MNMLRRIIAAVEPWYDWGTISITKLDALSEDEIVEGDVRYVDLQWFGIHLSLQFGRTPRRVAHEEAAA